MRIMDIRLSWLYRVLLLWKDQLKTTAKVVQKHQSKKKKKKKVLKWSKLIWSLVVDRCILPHCVCITCPWSCLCVGDGLSGWQRAKLVFHAALNRSQKRQYSLGAWSDWRETRQRGGGAGLSHSRLSQRVHIPGPCGGTGRPLCHTSKQLEWLIGYLSGRHPWYALYTSPAIV